MYCFIGKIEYMWTHRYQDNEALKRIPRKHIQLILKRMCVNPIIMYTITHKIVLHDLDIVSLVHYLG